MGGICNRRATDRASWRAITERLAVGAAVLAFCAVGLFSFVYLLVLAIRRVVG